MRRLTIFAKGNLDVKNSLHSFFLGGKFVWNGMVPVEEARTYHLTHRTGWRDPLEDTGWEDIFFRAHPIPEVKLLAVMWASLSDRSVIPPACRLSSLPELEKAARGDSDFDYDAVRRLIPGLVRKDTLR